MRLALADPPRYSKPFGPLFAEDLLLLKLRGTAALCTMCVGLLVSDIVQRLIIAPWVKLRPSARIPVLGRWQQLMAWFILSSISRIGGASIPDSPIDVPAAPGHLILMNHQSLFDIPLVVRTVSGGYPRIVTRKRYGRFIPLISHMTRLYQYPLVDPTAGKAELRAALDRLEEAGSEADVPIAAFPEGTRTRDGEIGRIRTGGLARLLRSRPWTVHVLVADGFWKAARFKDLVGEMGRIEGGMVHAGTFEWADTDADLEPFCEQVREMMVEALSEMRGAASAA